MGWSPSITARYFSSSPSDPTSRWTPCPPVVSRQYAQLRFRLGCLRRFRLRARLGFSLSAYPGQRGVTPAFGYGAPYPGTSGTLTHLIWALPSTHYGPLRHPKAPGLSLTGVRLVILHHVKGLPVLRAFPLCTCCRHYPGTATGALHCSIIQSYQPSPKWLSGRPVQRPFRGLLSVHSRYGLHTRAVTEFATRFTGGFNHFVDSIVAPVASGWSCCRVGLSPTGKTPPFHGARHERSFIFSMISFNQWSMAYTRLVKYRHVLE